jgi:hypothetical protein
LGNDQNRSTDLRQWEVHLVIGIAEQSKARCLIGHPVDFLWRITVSEAYEKEKTLPDASCLLVANADFCPRDPLE